MAPTLPETLPKARRARMPGSSNPVERRYANLSASNVLMSIAEYLSMDVEQHGNVFGRRHTEKLRQDRSTVDLGEIMQSKSGRLTVSPR